MTKHEGVKHIEICLGMNCRDNGGKELIAVLKAHDLPYTVSACRSLCPHAPVVFIDGKLCLKASVSDCIA